MTHRKTAQELVAHFHRSRGDGHTQLCVDALKANPDARIIVHTPGFAHILTERGVDRTQIVTMEAVANGRLRGRHDAITIDNAALANILHNLLTLNDELQKQVDGLKSQLVETINRT